MNNIYIGNRYVPIFADPINWSSEREYEPLTIVLHNNTSYTSRKSVPVGTPISDNQYWAKTGDYNAQVELYRREVNELIDDVEDLQGDVTAISGTVNNLGNSVTSLNNRVNTVEGTVSTLNTKVSQAESNISTLNNSVSNINTRLGNIEFTENLGTIVMIGDSYLEGYSPDGNVTSWGDRLAGFLGKSLNTTAFKFYKGGAGFGNTVDGKNYNVLTNDAYNALSSQASNVGAVIYIGGANEPTNITPSVIYNTLNNAKSKFTKAKIFYAYGSSGLNQTPYNRCNVITAYEKALSSVGKNCFYMSDLTNILRAEGSSVYASDKLHPNNDGQAILASAIYNGMSGVYTTASRETHQFETSFIEYIMDNVYTLEMFQKKAYSLNVDNYYANGTSLLKTIPVDTYIRRNEDLFYVAHTTGYIKTNDDIFHPATFTLRILPDKIDVYAYGINQGGTNYVSGTITAMEMMPFTYVTPIGVI